MVTCQSNCHDVVTSADVIARAHDRMGRVIGVHDRTSEFAVMDWNFAIFSINMNCPLTPIVIAVHAKIVDVCDLDQRIGLLLRKM